MIKGLYILDKSAYGLIYGEQERKDIAECVDIYAPQMTPQSVIIDTSILKDAEVILSGWHMPKATKQFLDATPNLKAIFYGAGSIKGFVTNELWERNIIVTSAYAANAIPVAEYTFAQIICCLKRLWHYAQKSRRQRSYLPLTANAPGTYNSTVGIISLGMTGQMVCRMLQQLSVKVFAYDPYTSLEVASELNVELCSLDEIFSNCDVVSIHAPLLPETRGLITGRHIASMKADSSIINTARGPIIREKEMIEVLKKRPDITAVIDVTCSEPPDKDSPLYTLENVMLTPHIAGSTARECRRLGRCMVEELHRYIKKQPLKWAISRQRSLVLA